MTDRDEWQPVGSTMPIGDHRYILREYLGPDGEVAIGYFDGREKRVAPVRADAPAMPFRPVGERSLRDDLLARELLRAVLVAEEQEREPDARLMQEAAQRVADAAPRDRDGTSRATQDVLNERRRQMDVEGWTPAHDDQHLDGSLAMAAALYAAPRPLYQVSIRAPDADNAGYPVHLPGSVTWTDPWPWRVRAHIRHDLDVMVVDGDKRNDHPRRKQLVVAGALILAEIERLDRGRRG